MEKIESEPILYRIQCKSCFSLLSYPFKYVYDPNKKDEDIKIDRFKGDNINFHSVNEYNNKGSIYYSYIHCLKCSQKVGYWVSQASKKEKKNINKLFFFQKLVHLIKYNKSDVTEEEDRKFKQEDYFYNSNCLTNEIIEYAKEHIDNFIDNVMKFEKERNEAEFCYKSFDKRIMALKNLFIKNVKDKDNAYHLGIDFSKEEQNEKLNNKNNGEEIQIEEDFDNKSNGKKNLNIINDYIDDEDNNHNLENKNGGGAFKSFSGSDIYLDDDKNKNNEYKKNSNKRKNKSKQPSYLSKNNEKKANKRKKK